MAEMLDDIILTFRELALNAFYTPAPEFSDEELLWEPALRNARYWWQIEVMLLNPMDALMLSDKAFLFCLPAYMIGGLRWEFFAIDSVLKLLYTPGSPWDSWNVTMWWLKCKQWERLMSQLTPDQKHVVRVWLMDLATLYPGKEVQGDYGSDRLDDRVAQMIHNYWGEY